MKAAWFRVAAALAVLLPSTTPAFEWAGRLGGIYSRDQQWQATGEGTTTPRLDLDLSLDGAGWVYSPEALTYGAGFGYRRVTMSPSNAPSSSLNQVDYRLRAEAFSGPTSPVTLQGYANRSEGDGAASTSSFNSTSQTFGGNLALRLADRPGLQLGYSHGEGRYRSPSYVPHENSIDTFTGSTQFSTPAFSYVVRYLGNVATGSFAGENFNDHRLDLSSRVLVFQDVNVTLGDSYYKREPTRTSGYNPRQEFNNFQSIGRHETRDGKESEQVRYVHSSGLTDGTTSVLTRTADLLEVSVRRPLSAQEWSLLATMAANYSDSRLESSAPVLATERLRTAGQSLAATTFWNRQIEDTRTSAFGGPTIGVVERFDGAAELGWGATAGAGVQRQFQRVLGGLSYGATYTTNAGDLGTSFSHSLTADAQGPVGNGQLRGMVTAAGERSHAPMTGDSASRSIRGNVDFGQRAFRAFGEVLYRDGVAFPLRDPFRGDGLFLSPGYDARSTSASGGVRGTVGGLGAGVSLRLTNIVMPDRPTQDELEARGELTYRIGAFGMGFEERYVTSLRDRSRSNLLFFRVYRLIGSRF